MTLSKIRSLQNATLSTFAREVLQTASEWDLGIILRELADNATIEEVDARLAEAWPTFVYKGLIDPAEPRDQDEDGMEDLMDGDLEDQLENLLADGDAKDKELEQGYPETVFEESQRYVVLVKARGVYLPELELESNELFVASCDFEDAYNQLDDILAERGGVGTVTLFDRDEDRDLKHVELVRYAKEV